MDRSVASVDGIHCHPHADRTKHTSGKQHLGASCFYVVEVHFSSPACLALGNSCYGPNALFSRRYWLLMVYDQNMVHTLYKNLLTFYPRAFRERLGDSMEQTFNNLYRERQTEGGWFGFMLWTFAETAVGIAQEHLLLLMEGDVMKTILTNPRLAAITSLILSLPLGLIFVVLMFNIQPLANLLFNLFTIEGPPGEMYLNTLGRIVIYGGLLLLPVAFALNLQSMLKRAGPQGK